MTQKILFVDDDANILAGYARSLRRQYTLDTALGPETGLERLATQGPYAVIVTDLTMPGMNGIQFLARAREIAPQTVRMMLTGNADLQTAIDALHQGSIFRFMLKPTPAEGMALALDAALEQYRLVTGERDLLEKTLGGAIRVLVEILTAIDPDAYGRAQGMRQYMRPLAAVLGETDTWKLELSALLSPIGLVTVPPAVVRKARQGSGLTEGERAMLAQIPLIGHGLLVNIPRLSGVAEVIKYSSKTFAGCGLPDDGVHGEALPIGSRILKVLSDLADLEASGLSRTGAFAMMVRQEGRHDPRVLAAAQQVMLGTSQAEAAPAKRSCAIALSDLEVGDVLAADVETEDGRPLLARGHRLTELLLARLRNFADLSRVKEPVYVLED